MKEKIKENKDMNQVKTNMLSIILKYKRVCIAGIFIVCSLVGLFIYEQGLINAPQIIEKTESVANVHKNITIQLEGAVHRPGVYIISTNMHLYEVLIQAGNILPEADLSNLNLAKIIEDGEKIDIPFIKKRTVSESNQKSSPANMAIRVNINTASKTDLMQLPGVGATYAENILDYREKNGAFKNISDMLKIKGIGPSKLKKISPYITL